MSFELLKAQIIDKDLCERCGLCVGTCNAISMVDGLPKLTGRCILTKGAKYCGRCYDLCPQAHPEKIPPQIPETFAAVSLRSKNKAILENASDGGFVTELLTYLLETDNFDSVAAVSGEKYSPEGIVVSEAADVSSLTGTRYSPTFVLTGLVENLRDTRDRMAVVALPCEMRGVHRFEETLGIEILKIGLFCSNNTRVGADGKREKLPACNHCTDFIATHADISCGFAGSQKGFTTVLAFTEKGAEVIKESIASNLFEEGSLDMLKVEKNQQRKSTRETLTFEPEVRTKVLMALEDSESKQYEVPALAKMVGIGTDELFYHLLVLQQYGLVQSIEDKTDPYRIMWSAVNTNIVN
ncbi:MAG: Coenzyme F420 hydrogenase/dehydrogenase, beta subunit C-terminal domain [Candidatus Thorarchaeota archaeon]